MSQFRYERIPISLLSLNLANPRFDPVQNQKAAISEMISEQGHKLVNLAQDIIENGLNPSDLPIVVPAQGDKNGFTVLEGNRRITAIKLMVQPDLIPAEYPWLRRQFKRLNGKISLDDISTVNCVVLEDSDAARHWISLKHTGQNNGVGVVTWDTVQQKRFIDAGKDVPSLTTQIMRFIENNLDDYHKSNASRIPSTNLERLLGDPYVRDALLFSPLIDLEKILLSAIIQIRGKFHDKKRLYARIQRTDIKGMPRGRECCCCRQTA